MKKSILFFIIAGLVLIGTALYLFASANLNSIDLIQSGVILIIVGFAIFAGLKKLRNFKRGEPTEDELSRKILQKAAATSYYISLYIWLFMIFLNDKIQFDTEELVGTGIIAMAGTFGISWLIINFKGIKQ